jgi:hypothetical protein
MNPSIKTPYLFLAVCLCPVLAISTLVRSQEPPPADYFPLFGTMKSSQHLSRMGLSPLDIGKRVPPPPTPGGYYHTEPPRLHAAGSISPTSLGQAQPNHMPDPSTGLSAGILLPWRPMSGRKDLPI